MKTRAFETKVAQYLGKSDGVVVASGTAALFFALHALEIGKGDEVIVPTYVCRSVVEAVLATGAKPVLCDVGEDWNMTAATVDSRI